MATRLKDLIKAVRATRTQQDERKNLLMPQLSFLLSGI